MKDYKQKSTIWSKLTKPFRTKHYRFTALDDLKINIKNISIVHNDNSLIIPMGVYPSHEEINDFVKDSRPSISRIDSLISIELLKHRISSIIVNDSDDIENSYYLEYQDYWAWDFKKYMPVLEISLFDSENNELISVISEGSTSGMHDYPSPKKHVPILVDLILDKICIN